MCANMKRECADKGVLATCLLHMRLTGLMIRAVREREPLYFYLRKGQFDFETLRVGAFLEHEVILFGSYLKG